MILNTTRKNLLGGFAFALTGALSATTSHAASSDILFVLDGSGSMWGQIGGVAKIETAKTTMAKLMDDVPADARIGFMTYGTTSKQSCDDVTVLNALGADRSAIKGSIASIKPLGKTPIQKSLIDGLGVLEKSEPADVQKSLVLVSDGIETCDGDPCAIAATAKERGIAMDVHVVGFDVDADARAQLECIAEKGGGQYFNASDTEGFKVAMNAVVQVAQAQKPVEEPKAEPVAATSEIIFEDDFDGEALDEVWNMIGADEDSYIVEEGELLMVSAKKQSLNIEQPTNLLQLGQKMPKGDWDMNLYLKLDPQTGNDHFWFGLYKDPKNSLSVQYWVEKGFCSRFVVRLNRWAKGERTFFDKNTAGSKNCGHGNDDIEAVSASHAEEGIILTLSKRGRNYTATARLGGHDLNNPTSKVVTTESLTSLRVPGDLAMMVGKWGDVSGEVLSLIDRVEIVAVK